MNAFTKRNIYHSMLPGLIDFITFSRLGSVLAAAIFAVILCVISLIRFLENHKYV